MEMTKDFSAFRTRLLGAWLLCNVTYVSVILHFDLLTHFVLALSLMVLWTLACRMLGTLLSLKRDDWATIFVADSHCTCKEVALATVTVAWTLL